MDLFPAPVFPAYPASLLMPIANSGGRNGDVCAGEAGGVLWMRVPYGEGIAGHTGSESCGGVREDAVEALTGVRAGWVLSLENFSTRSADGLRPSEGNTGRVVIARPGRAPRGLRPQGEALPSQGEALPHLARTQAPREEGGALRSEAGRSRVRPEPPCGDRVRAVNSNEERRR